jgi:hypothetical protein
MRSGLEVLDMYMAGIAIGGGLTVIMAFYTRGHAGQYRNCTFVNKLYSGMACRAIRFNGGMLAMVKAGERAID